MHARPSRRDLSSFLKRQQRFSEYVDPDEGNGELTIFIPKSLQESHTTTGAATTTDETPATDTVYKVTIDFALEQPECGIHFFVPDDDAKLSRVKQNTSERFQCRGKLLLLPLAESTFVHHGSRCSPVVSLRGQLL